NNWRICRQRLYTVAMTLELSDQQREALGRATAGPVYLLDPVSHARYVLLRDETYERFRSLFEEDPFDVAEAYPLVGEVARKEGSPASSWTQRSTALICSRSTRSGCSASSGGFPSP